MKYLKYFESNSIKDNFYEKEYGVSSDELKYFFTDLTDNGWSIKIGFYKKLYKFDVHEPIKPGDITVGFVPYIEVIITKDWDRFEVSQWKATQYLNELINSEEYLEIIDVAAHRLADSNLFVQRQYIENKQIHILIYRKIDKNYVK